MIELTKKCEPQDIVAALFGISFSIEQIRKSQQVSPVQLYKVVAVMQGLLVIRQLLAVQMDCKVDAKCSERLLEMATNVICSAKVAMWQGPGTELERLIHDYSATMDCAARLLKPVNNLESVFNLALGWNLQNK